MQIKLTKKRLIIRYAYIIKNGKETKVKPMINRNGKWEKIDLFEEYLISFVDYNMMQSDIQKRLRIKESSIDLIKCFEWLMCTVLAVLFVVYLLDIIKRW